MNSKLKAFIEVDDNGDRGIVAEEDIEEGQQLVLIPLSCCLHMPTPQEQAISQVCYCFSTPRALEYEPRLHLAVLAAVGLSQSCN